MHTLYKFQKFGLLSTFKISPNSFQHPDIKTTMKIYKE